MDSNLKDWQIAKEMFGRNTKRECRIVNTLRNFGVITSLNDDTWSLITDSRKDDGGWLFPNIFLNK